MLLGLPLLLGFAAPAAAQANGKMPQIMLNQEHFTVDEPQDDNCSDSKVGTETTSHVNQNTNKLERVERHYGKVLTSVPYKVQLDRTPGPGKYVSVEIWDPTDLDRPDVRDGFHANGSTVLTGHFSQNARIHGISWRGGQQGRISIAKSFRKHPPKAAGCFRLSLVAG